MRGRQMTYEDDRGKASMLESTRRTRSDTDQSCGHGAGRRIPSGAVAQGYDTGQRSLHGFSCFWFHFLSFYYMPDCQR